jgi:hypothetical protein
MRALLPAAVPEDTLIPRCDGKILKKQALKAEICFVGAKEVWNPALCQRSFAINL